MFPGEDYVMILETTKQSLERGTQTFVVAQIVLTLLLSVSLKSMWNLYNVCQILAYIRLFTNWPALMDSVFLYLDNAITLKPISDAFFDYGQTEYERVESTLNDEKMKAMGIQDIALSKNLGVYGIVFLTLVLFMGLFAIVSYIPSCIRFKKYLRKKLFYHSFIRYMIVSNLKFNYTITAFLISSWSFATFFDGIRSYGYVLAMTAAVGFPIFIMVFMVRNKNILEESNIR